MAGCHVEKLLETSLIILPLQIGKILYNFHNIWRSMPPEIKIIIVYYMHSKTNSMSSALAT